MTETANQKQLLHLVFGGELQSLESVEFKDLDKPYFIQYTILDEDEYSVDATFGSIIT